MRRLSARSICAALLATALAAPSAFAAPTDPLASADALALGPDGVMFVADSRRGRVVAFQRPKAAPAKAASFNLYGFDRIVAGQMGTTVDQVRLTDVAYDQTTHTAYVAVRRGFGDDTIGAVFAARADGTVSPIDIAAASPTEALLGDLVRDDVPLPRDRRMRDFTITDIDFHGGELYVAGMSGTAFDSVLRRVPFPFTGKAGTSKLEIFHAAHNQNETRAPIRAQTFVDVGGAWHAVAAYTCTPLVLFPVDGLKDGARVVGKTISELGYGNTPTDILTFSAADMKGNVADYLLLLNRQRAPVMMPLAAVVDAAGKPGLKDQAGFGKAGVTGMEVPLVGWLEIADQSPSHLIGLKRDPETGTADLLSIRKNLFLRLTDFVAEYDMPTYAYPKDAGPEGAGFRSMLHGEEGFRP